MAIRKIDEIVKLGTHPLEDFFDIEAGSTEMVTTHRRTEPAEYEPYDVKDKEIVKGKNILLIDDLKTTGSTLNECAKMLNIYGASGVWSATIAITPEKKKR